MNEFHITVEWQSLGNRIYISPLLARPIVPAHGRPALTLHIPRNERIGAVVAPYLLPVGPNPGFVMCQRRQPRLCMRARSLLAQMPLEKWPESVVPAQENEQQANWREEEEEEEADTQAEQDSVSPQPVPDDDDEPRPHRDEPLTELLRNLRLDPSTLSPQPRRPLPPLPTLQPTVNTGAQAPTLVPQHPANGVFPPSPDRPYPTPPPAYGSQHGHATVQPPPYYCPRPQTPQVPTVRPPYYRPLRTLAELGTYRPPAGYYEQHPTAPRLAPPGYRPQPQAPSVRPLTHFCPLPTPAALGPYRPPAGYYEQHPTAPGPTPWNAFPPPNFYAPRPPPNRPPGAQPQPPFRPQSQLPPVGPPTVHRSPHNAHNPQAGPLPPQMRQSTQPAPSPLALPAPASPPPYTSAIFVTPPAPPPRHPRPASPLQPVQPVRPTRPALLLPTTPLVPPASPNTQRIQAVHDAARRSSDNPPTSPDTATGHAFLNGVVLADRSVVPEQVTGADIFPYGPRAERVATPVDVLQRIGEEGRFAPNGINIVERPAHLAGEVGREWRRLRRWLSRMLWHGHSPARIRWRMRVFLARAARVRRSENSPSQDKPHYGNDKPRDGGEKPADDDSNSPAVTRTSPVPAA